MKNKIVFALLCAATMLGLSACNKNEEFEPENGRIHSATFKVQLADDADTKTALMFKMVPDWRNTDVNDIHIFETETTSGGSYFMEASKVEMTTPVDDTYEKALFYAEFDNATVIVTPPETKAGNSVFSYTAILGQRVGDTYTLPAIQYPHEESNIDPKADFLVGRVMVDRTETLHEQTFDINFHRPVALSRMFITNLEGSKVLSIKITSLDDLTGSLKYSDIDFSIDNVANIAQAADFKHNDNSNVLTLLYPGGRTRTSVFQPFFVTVAGAKRITEVEVRTDQYIYTKTYGANGATITFSASQFNNITMDMTVKEGGNVTRTVNNSQDIKYMLGDEQVTEENGIVYDLFEHGGSVEDFVAPTLTGAVGDVTYNSSKTSVATVDAEGAVTLTGELGDVVISAYAAGDDEYSPGSASYKITVKDSSPVVQELSFDPASLTVTLGDDFTEPTLSGAMTAVSYSSDDEEVATVNSETGKLTLVGAGEATITATAVEGEVDGVNYTEGTASYALTVLAAAQGTTYYKASVLEAGYDYLIVSSGQALKNNGNASVVAASEVQVTDDTITLNDNEAESLLWTAAAAPSLDSNFYGTHTLTNGTEHLWRHSNNGTYTVEGSNADVTKYMIWNYEDEKLWNISIYNSTASNYYTYYDSGWKSVQSSSAPSVKTYIFTARQPQTLSFASETATHDLASGNTFNGVALNGVKTSVSYSSGDETIATVASDGTVTVLKKGEVEITATAASSAQFQGASASYTLTVVNTNEKVSVYNKVTSVTDLEVGAKYLLVFEGLAGDADDGDPKVYNPVLNNDGTQFAKATSSALDVTIANSTIESSDFDDCQFTLEAGYYLKGDKANKYIYPGSSGSSSVMLAEASASHALTIAFSDGIAEINNGSRYLVWSTSNHYFSCNTSVSGQYSTGICLYKLDDGRLPQTLAFTALTARYDLIDGGRWCEGENPPSLDSSGAETSIYYSSSNTAVAEVNPTTGAVTIPLATAKKGDSAIITATAVADEQYKEAKASYTINIIDSTPSTGKTYTRISGAAELVTGTYLIVDKTDTYVFNASGTNHGGYGTIGTTEGISQNGTTITLTDAIASDYEFVFTRTNNNLTIKPVGGDFAGKYMYATNSVSNTYIDFKSEATNFVVDVQANTNYVYFATPKSSTSYTEYLYKKSSDTFFKLGGSGSPTAQDPKDAGIYLYKLNDGGTTPEPPTPTPTTTYSLITPSEFVSGGTYLIVSADSGNYNSSDKTKAFAGDEDGNVVTVDGTSGTITGDFSACEFVITASGSNYTLKIGSNYVTGDQNSGSRYIRVNTTSGTMSLASATELSSASSGDGKVADAFYFYYTKSSSKEVLYLNSDGKYKIGGSGRKYGVYLFKKN